MNMNLDAHKTTWVSVRLESSIWTIWTQIRARFMVYSLICEPLSNLICSEFTRKLSLTKYHITVWAPLLKRLKQWQMWYEMQNEKHLMKLVKNLQPSEDNDTDCLPEEKRVNQISTCRFCQVYIQGTLWFWVFIQCITVLISFLHKHTNKEQLLICDEDKTSETLMNQSFTYSASSNELLHSLVLHCVDHVCLEKQKILCFFSVIWLPPHWTL